MTDRLLMARAGSGLAWAAVFFTLEGLLNQLCVWALRGWTNDILLLSTLSVFPAALAVGFSLPRQNGADAVGGIGLEWKPGRLTFSLCLGAVAVAAAIGGLLVAGWASIGSTQPNLGPAFALALIVGVAGEELVFRGYGFQQLARALTPLGAAFATSAAFGILHYSNPGATPLAALNTGLFGLLFGVALVRSRSLWIPFGMHLAWNLLLALLGARVSGLTMRLTTLEVLPQGSEFWSGGEYGPEASPVVTLVVAAVLLWVWRQPFVVEQRRLVLGVLYRFSTGRFSLWGIFRVVLYLQIPTHFRGPFLRFCCAQPILGAVQPEKSRP